MIKLLRHGVWLAIVILLQSCEGYAQTIGHVFDALHDSLDAISLPVPVYKYYSSDISIQINNQSQWNDIPNILKYELEKGYRNITIEVTAKTLYLEDDIVRVEGLKYPDANIRIVGNNVTMIPSGAFFSRNDNGSIKEKTHYSLPYHDFNLDDVLLDYRNKPLSLYEDFFYVDSKIEAVRDDGKEDVLNKDGSLYKTFYRTWRFRTNLPDLSTEECKDFYILLTRNWTSNRHKVNKVENGYLYFTMRTEDATSLVKMCLSPNSDFEHYNIRPRCRFVNSPVSTGIHITKGWIYIPNKIKQVRIGKGGGLVNVENCNFKTFEISGFYIKSAGNGTCIRVHNCFCENQLWIKDNRIENASGRAIQVSMCRNASIYNNTVLETRMNAIYASGWDVSIWKNHLKNIGYMSQTMALTITGENIHVFENVIEDFNYSGISPASDPTFIIEHNIISYTPAFLKKHQNVTLADGGGIYVGPRIKSGIIRYNVIENMTGTGANRGIFLDDGSKNLNIYGNLVMNTSNSYDIDLRLSDTYAKQIPDHNTNNNIFHNIMTGGYRFEDKGSGSNCLGGENILCGIGERQKTKISVEKGKDDIVLEGVSYKKGNIVIPMKYASLLDSVYIDSFVRSYLTFR